MRPKSRRSLRRLASNAAVLAVLLHGLLPAFTQAMALRDGAAPCWVQVCDAQGQHGVALPVERSTLVDPETEPADAPTPWQAAACRLYLAQAATWALPTHRAGLTPAAVAAVAPCAPPHTDTHMPAWRVGWAVPAVRAPPAAV